MSNDNTSYWTGELGYSAIAFLLKLRVLEYRPELGQLLEGIAWKDINQKFKNDFDAALQFILQDIKQSDRDKLYEYTETLVKDVGNLYLKRLGKSTLPPEGY